MNFWPIIYKLLHNTDTQHSKLHHTVIRHLRVYSDVNNQLIPSTHFTCFKQITENTVWNCKKQNNMEDFDMHMFFRQVAGIMVIKFYSEHRVHSFCSKHQIQHSDWLNFESTYDNGTCTRKLMTVRPSLFQKYMYLWLMTVWPSLFQKNLIKCVNRFYIKVQ